MSYVMLLPEYNDPGLNVIIWTLCGISLLPSGLQRKCTALGLALAFKTEGGFTDFYRHHVNLRLFKFHVN